MVGHKCTSLCLKMAHERSWVAWGRSEDPRCLGHRLELLLVSVVMDGPGFPAQVVQWDRHSPLSPICRFPPGSQSPVSSSSERSHVCSQGSSTVRMSERIETDLCLSAPPSYSAVTHACVRGPEDELKAARKG